MFLLIFLVWLYLLFKLKQLNMKFFKFIVGSVGLFCLLMYIGREWAEKHLEFLITYIVSYFVKHYALFIVQIKYSMITVYYKKEAMTFFVDYECSGIIEILVFISLVVFYPLYTSAEKIKRMFMGVVYICLANVFRILLICIIIGNLGPSVFYLTHTVFARIMFFLLMIVLYYKTFTEPHILKQKVGKLK